MALNPEAFVRRLETIARGVPAEVERVVRKATLVVDQVAVQATPVDTGRARSNWAVSTGQSVTEEPVKESFDRSGGVAMRQAGEVVRSYKLKSGTIFIANNVPYIGFLEKGSSRQAPNGMLSRAIQAGVQVVRREKVRIR